MLFTLCNLLASHRLNRFESLFPNIYIHCFPEFLVTKGISQLKLGRFSHGSPWVERIQNFKVFGLLRDC